MHEERDRGDGVRVDGYILSYWWVCFARSMESSWHEML
jgi:hypothetical protein